MAAGRDRSGLRKSLGPGLVWAATAIGVSHLVQSTRAGAVYGYSLIAAVVLANLLKYPFFEYGPRYAAATGESLLEGYRRLGRWTVWVYLALTVGTMFAIVGAVTLVTGSIATQLFGGGLSAFGYSAVMLAASGVVLVVGRYPLLDGLIKGIIVVLTVSTLAAVVMALGVHRAPAPGFAPPALWDFAGFSFLIALIGWMPSAVDIAVWHSLWTLERAKQTGHRPRLGEALFDFNLGYLGTAVVALFFLVLGARILYGSGEQIAAAPAAFAAQLVGLYTRALGSWSRPVILVAAFTTMFSTTLSCVDAFPRVLQRTTEVLRPGLPRSGRLYWAAMLVLVAGSLLLIGVFQKRLTLMVDVATTLSFLTSPILGYFNYRVVTSPAMPAGTTPPPWLRWLSWAGLAFGFGFGAVFLVWRFLLG
jgi:Mn2+/Fe2+ NRAMP family transporter